MLERMLESLPSWVGSGQQSKRFYFILYFLLFGVGVVSCSGSPLGIGGINISQWGVNVTKINALKETKEGTIYLHGQVATRAPFLETGAYKLQDDTGTIWVIANQIPNVGDEVLIKGQLQFQSIPVSGQELGEVYVQQEQQLERKGRSKS